MRGYNRLAGIGAALIATILTVVLGGAGGTIAASASTDPKVTIAGGGNLVWWFPAYVAEEGGFFKKQGLNVTLTSTQSGITNTQLLAGGTVQYALDTPADALNSTVAGVSVHIVATLFQRYQQSLIAKASEKSKIKSLANLGGLPFGIPESGSAGWQFAETVYNLGGVSMANQDLQSIGGPAISAGTDLTNGLVDVQIDNTPFDLETVATGKAYFLLDPDDLDVGFGKKYPQYVKLVTEPYTYTDVMATTSFIKAHPSETQKLVNAMQEAENFIQSEPVSKTVKLLLESPVTAPTGVKWLTKTVTLVRKAHGFASSVVTSAADYKDAENLAVQINSKDAISFSQVVDNKFAEKAVKTVGTRKETTS